MQDPHLEPKTVEWLESARRIPAEIAAQCGVVTMHGWPAFEYRRNGRLQYVKARREDQSDKSFYRVPAKTDTCLFLEDRIETDPDLSSPLVICEGEIDALSLVAVGVPNVVSVPDGAQLEKVGDDRVVIENDKAFSWLWGDDGLKPAIAQFDRFILAVDGDKKGRVLREELAVRLQRWRCEFVTYPDGCKDANDVLVKHGPEALAEVIANAKPMVPNRLVRFSDLPHVGTGEVYGSGFQGLDDDPIKLNVMAPELIVVTGEPGSGKSEFAAVFGANLANYHGLPGAILQFEDRSSRVRDTLVRYAMSQVPSCKDSRQRAQEWVDQYFRTIEPEQNIDLDVDYNLEWLQSTLREARTRHGCRWAIIDPWNELEHIWDRTQSEAVYTNDALRRIKRLSRAYQMIIFIVAHPSKEGGRVKEIADLDLYCIAGSAAWNNKADHGIIVHRPDKSKQDVYIKIAKSKDHMTMGRPGIVRMRYLIASAKYSFIGHGV